MLDLVSVWSRERPQSRCVCRERDGGPHSLLSTWDGGIIDDMPRSEGHLSGRLSRLVVKDHLLCVCLWETLMFIYRGKNRSTSVSICPLVCVFSGSFCNLCLTFSRPTALEVPALLKTNIRDVCLFGSGFLWCLIRCCARPCLFVQQCVCAWTK